MTASQTKHINCHSDFTLTERFITIDDEGNSAPAGVPECDFRLIYRTRSWHTVAVGRIAGELTPDCRINDDGSLIPLTGEQAAKTACSHRERGGISRQHHLSGQKGGKNRARRT